MFNITISISGKRSLQLVNRIFLFWQLDVMQCVKVNIWIKFNDSMKCICTSWNDKSFLHLNYIITLTQTTEKFLFSHLILWSNLWSKLKQKSFKFRSNEKLSSYWYINKIKKALNNPTRLTTFHLFLLLLFK